MKELTKAEEQIMQVLWDLGEGVVRDILDRLPQPKPAYNTVSTIVRILEKKEFVSHRAVGKTHVYYPAVEIEDYRKYSADKLMRDYFEGSPKTMVSYFLENEEIDLTEMDEIIRLLNQKKKDA